MTKRREPWLIEECCESVECHWTAMTIDVKPRDGEHVAVMDSFEDCVSFVLSWLNKELDWWWRDSEVEEQKRIARYLLHKRFSFGFSLWICFGFRIVKVRVLVHWIRFGPRAQTRTLYPHPLYLAYAPLFIPSWRPLGLPWALRPIDSCISFSFLSLDLFVIFIVFSCFLIIN